jgi:hypothetical protein
MHADHQRNLGHWQRIVQERDRYANLYRSQGCSVATYAAAPRAFTITATDCLLVCTRAFYSTDELEGVIEGTFGKSGKYKVSFPAGGLHEAPPGHQIRLRFKKFIHQPKASTTKLVQ